MGLFGFGKKKTEAAPKAAPAAEKIEEIKEAAAPVIEKAEQIAGTVGDKAAEVVEAVKEKAADVIGSIEDQAAEAREVVEDTVAAVAEEQAAPVEEIAVEEIAVEEVAVVEPAAPAEEAPVEEATAEEGAPSCGNPAGEELTEKEKGTVYAVRMNYHAGYDRYKVWPNGGVTIHAGIGWFHPFGPSEYYGMANIPGNFCEESKQFPLEHYFTEDWMKNFETDLFCIYRMPDGDIYAWDGMFAVRGLDENKCVVYNSEYTRQDVLVNVIVGGTGRYEGVRGLLIGTAEGGGETKVCGEMPDGSPLELPATIMKDLQGYIRFPE